MSQNETADERKFVKFALTRKCLAIKLINLAKRGWPDRTIIGPNRLIFFFEFKDGDNALSAHQRKWKRILETFGFKYYVCRSYEEAEAYLESEISANKSGQ